MSTETSAVTETTARDEWISGLRELADFIEANPQLDVAPWDGNTFLFYCSDRDELAGWARAMGRAEKNLDEQWYRVVREFGVHKLQAYAGRDLVCERVVVGTETVTVEEPDPNAPKVKKEVEREIVEWRCDDPLLAPSRESAAA